MPLANLNSSNLRSDAIHSELANALIRDSHLCAQYFPRVAAMVRLTLGLVTTAAALTAAALAPSVGTVVKGNRKITVIGTAHTPSRRQREEVEALIAEVKPDAVLVELDAERLEFAWNQPEEAYGGELAAAVRAARRIEAPVVLGDAYRPA